MPAPTKINAKYEDLYGSEYLSPDDLEQGKEIEAEFINYEVRQLFCQGKKNTRLTVAASVNGKATKKRICINKTSAKALARAWGKEFDGWLNKPVTIRRGMVNRKAAILICPAGQATQPNADDISDEGFEGSEG